MCVGTHKYKISEDYDGQVSRDMLHLGFPTIFSRTKNQILEFELIGEKI